MPAAAELLTPRLRLRGWEAADEAPMAAINRDPEVTRYLNRPVDEDAVAAFFALMTGHWVEHGFGPYALEERDGENAGRFIGFVGIAYPAYLPEVATRPELGWRLARAAWGRGLASEAARAVRDHAFADLGFEELIAVIHPDNARSQRLAAGLGMALEGHVYNWVLGRETGVWRLGAG
jgi:RimJ/RimL family protein N-acetyltransferase